jgi:hypothetical protein
MSTLMGRVPHDCAYSGAVGTGPTPAGKASSVSDDPKDPPVLTGEIREAAKRLYALAIAGLVISPEDTRAVHVVLDELIRLSRQANTQPNEVVNQ